MDHVMVVLVMMLTRVTKPLMGLLLMARMMMHGRLHMVHELILLLLLLMLVIHGGLTVVTVIVSGIIVHMT